MQQREIDVDGLKYTCVQALAGVGGEAAEAAQRKMDEADHVPVVCTPSGEAQSVRLALAPDWAERMQDEELADAIRAARG